MQNQPVGNSVVRVTSALTELILTGELPTGEPIREVELAKQLGTSRTPVREAIAQMVARGLLTKESGRSARVRQPTLEDILELYELRALTESFLAGKAAESIDQPTLDRLVDLEEKLRKTTGDEWYESHADFHRTIFDAASRSRFSMLANELRMQSEPYVRLAIRLDTSLPVAAACEHAQLLEAMQTGNSVMAREVTERHLQSTVEAVDRVYRAVRGLNIPFAQQGSSVLQGG